jgi:predicted dehydrogenase
MENKKIRIGIIGCGRVAHNHAKAIELCKNAELTEVAGGRNAAKFADLYHAHYVTTDEICSLPDIDAILVLTPYKFHYDYTISALKNGKHVLVEKPVSFKTNEIEDMEAAAKKTGSICMPGHSYIYLPELSRIKREIGNDGIGQPTYMYLSEIYYMPPDMFFKYEGPEIDVICHELYMSLAYLGVPSYISAFSSDFDKSIIETGGPQIIVNLKYPNGALGQISLSWACDDNTSDPWTFKVKLLGDKGGFHFSRRDYVVKDEKGIEQPLYQEMFNYQMDYFINRCILGGEEPLSTISDALIVCKLHNIILNSIKTGETIKVNL